MTARRERIPADLSSQRRSAPLSPAIAWDINDPRGIYMNEDGTLTPEQAIAQGYTHFLDDTTAFPFDDLEDTVQNHRMVHRCDPEFEAAKADPNSYSPSKWFFDKLMESFAASSYEDALSHIEIALEPFKPRFDALLQEMASRINIECPCYISGPGLDVSGIPVTQEVPA